MVLTVADDVPVVASGVGAAGTVAKVVPCKMKSTCECFQSLNAILLSFRKASLLQPVWVLLKIPLLLMLPCALRSVCGFFFFFFFFERGKSRTTFL